MNHSSQNYNIITGSQTLAMQQRQQTGNSSQASYSNRQFNHCNISARELQNQLLRKNRISHDNINSASHSTASKLLLKSQKKASSRGGYHRSGHYSSKRGGESGRILQGVKNLIKMNSQIEDRQPQNEVDDAYSRLHSSNGIQLKLN